nr:hypothetical protein [uncultured Flavobacterium sp.]
MINLIRVVPLLFLLTSFIALGQNKINFIDSLGRKQGLWEEVIDSSQLRKIIVFHIEKANYLDDKLHGSYSLIERGKITYEAEYFEGNLTGYERFYNNDGSLKRIVHRQDTVIDFELKFNPFGSPKEESYFIKGQLFIKRKYHSNGRVSQISYYKDNELNGMEYYFKKNGKSFMTIEYDHGRVVRTLK